MIPTFPSRDAMATSKKILLADDNVDSREIYGTLFEHCGYDVIMAGDGPTAVEVAIESQPDIMLLNLFLPGMSGHEVLKALRSNPRTESLCCLMLTGDARPEQMGEALVRGADAYLTKPVEPREVLEIVEGMLADEC